ncbi:hypothetical protein F5050DRAFT_1810448 [Lentinula boryana]|uniref:Uncharacterized protein n=1 Tax=Lentinula boryana TaxID=40481 RepID=A0ABQ8Q487_9AGAR|nr:hypothetical protein F5050DRAFT_1810448 [Lentinula boryana]
MRLIIPSYLVILIFGVFAIVRATPVNLPRTIRTSSASGYGGYVTITFTNGQEGPLNGPQNVEINREAQELALKFVQQKISEDFPSWMDHKIKLRFYFVHHYYGKLSHIELRVDAELRENGKMIEKMGFNGRTGQKEMDGALVGALTPDRQ